MKRLYEKLIGGIRAYFEESGIKRAVIGLSGGVDSALSLKLTADAIGKANVMALLLPERGCTKKEDVMDAESLCKSLKIKYRIIEINDILDWFGQIKQNRVSWINLKPRIRMLILYNHANLNNALVVGTSNKTELVLGYFTKYGDGACDIEVIGDLYKTDVWRLAKFLKLPDGIINKAPSAGLYKEQSDEREIGERYVDIDKMLKGRKGKSVGIKKLIEQNRHKTEKIPIIKVH
jgi:NAD+ synthase